MREKLEKQFPEAKGNLRTAAGRPGWAVPRPSPPTDSPIPLREPTPNLTRTCVESKERPLLWVELSSAAEFLVFLLFLHLKSRLCFSFFAPALARLL